MEVVCSEVVGLEVVFLEVANWAVGGSEVVVRSEVVVLVISDLEATGG